MPRVRGRRGWLGPDDFALDGAPPLSGTPGAVRAAPGIPPGPEAREAVALQLATARGAVTRRELAAACRISGERARLALVALVRHGALRRVGAGRAARYVLP